MNKKISLGLALALIIMAVTATFAATMAISKQVYNGIINNISQRSQTYASVDEISKLVSNYYYGTVSDSNVLNSALTEGYVDGLGDPNSRYLTAAEYAAYTARLESGVTGIGVETTYDLQGDRLVITYVHDGSPAQESGLVAGDAITAVNGEAVTSKNVASMQAALFGNRLSTVKVEYERAGVTREVEPMLGFAAPSVRGELIGNTALIKIGGFYKNTADELKTLIGRLRDSGAQSIIFDVRNVSDGTVDYAAQAIDVLVPTVEGNLAVARDKNGNVYKNKVYTAENNSVPMPFLVLINSNTAGPAELFAADLRDISHAQLVGTQSAGVGTMQELFPLEDGGAVLLTVALLEPKGGASAVWDGTGLVPGVPVQLTNGNDRTLELLAQTQDQQLTSALNMLQS